MIEIKNRTFLSVSFVYFFLLTIYSLHIPFFWDGTFFSELAVNFFTNGFNGFIAPQKNDTGGFPFYSIYLTLVWKLFGKTLAVSHFALLPFLIGVAYEYFKLAKQFLSGYLISFAMLLLIVEPVFTTQSILLGYDCIMVYFFLLSLNALLTDRNKLFQIGISLLCICCVRGVILGLALLVIDFFLRRSTSNVKTRIRNYILPASIIVGWVGYHYYQTGWFFVSPERENTDEAMVTFPMAVRQFVFILWKINDFGRIALWLFLFIGTTYFIKAKRIFEFKNILLIVFVPLFLLILFMIPIANPVGHKYFIVVFLCLNIGVCRMFQFIKKRSAVICLQFLFCVFLITGNFWYYPERYGNGWDSSFKIFPYFHLKDEMDAFIQGEKIDPAQIGTQFPLIADIRDSHLSGSSRSYTNVWKGPISNFPYFLHTNIINSDIPQQLEEVEKKWELVKRFESGQVNISLYRNNR